MGQPLPFETRAGWQHQRGPSSDLAIGALSVAPAVMAWYRVSLRLA